MTLNEAIKILTHMSKSTNVSSLEECTDALKLGAEATKAFRDARKEGLLNTAWLLPGETKE